ncbi:MAG: DNA internalization-related competence protein ComEC/Rec2 [Candidatus Accumulibacter sp.]|jgi:competence protein ComEC|nr:DNA internalization-related competence protein ComEC/Rec2 [Accumulibacter sp.]
MRSSILAFAAGVVLLQFQGNLPPLAWVGVLFVAGIALVVFPALATIQGGDETSLVSRAFFRARFFGGFGGLRGLGGLLLGFAWAAGTAHYRLADALPEEWETRTIELTGVVAAMPTRSALGERFAFDVESVQTEGARVPRRIMLSWYRPRGGAMRKAASAKRPAKNTPMSSEEESADAPTRVAAGSFFDPSAALFRPGERWRFSVRLRRPHGNANPHGSDYEAWMLERGIRATGSIDTRAKIGEMLDAFVARPGYALESFRDRIRARFFAALPDAPYVGVLVALAIGDQRSITTAQWEIFRRTGITHLVSISGLHVTMVGALFGWLVSRAWRRFPRLMFRAPAQKAGLVAGWLAAFFYALLAGFEVPAQRTFYMLSVVVLSLLSGKNFGARRTLLSALLAVLLLDPWAVLSPGFWLSFGAVVFLFLVGSARVAGTRGRDKESSKSRVLLFDEPKWRSAFEQWGTAQWGVTLGTLPLLLIFFQQFSLVSPLVNALAIPFVSFLITPLTLVFAVFPWAPLLSLDHWLFEQLMRFVEALAVWPLWRQAAPPLWAALLSLVGVIWLLLPRGFPGRIAGGFLLLPALFLRPDAPASGEVWADVLDVGQGLSVVVRTAGHTLLYDTGPVYTPESSAASRVIVPFLYASGVDRIDALVVSHRDQDHAGGIETIRASFPVRRVLSSMDLPEGERCAADAEGTREWEWDGVRFTLLHPLKDDYAVKSKKPNNLSCVLRVSTASGSLLLTGDIETADERRLIARSSLEALRATALVVPHHGSRGGSSPAFVAAVAPEEAIVSAGYRNRFGHPRPEVLARYGASRVWRTDRDGAIRLRFAAAPAGPDGSESFHASSWRQEKPRYWYEGISSRSRR